MENAVRSLVTAEVQRIAREKGWRVYEVNERGGNYSPPYIYTGYADWEATPFNKRTPDNFLVSFIFIINPDSLQAWKSYLLNDVQDQAKAAADQYMQVQNNPLMKRYTDSLDAYIKEYTDFTVANSKSYMENIQSKNQQGIRQYEDGVKAIKEKMDAIQQKMADLSKPANDNAAGHLTTWHKRQSQFAESSMALINFDINPFSAGYFDVQQGIDVNTLHKRKLAVPNAFFASVLDTGIAPDNNSYVVDSYSFLCRGPAHDAAVLFGSFLPPDGYGHYRPVFTKGHHDKQSVLGTVKAVPCDKVQNVAVHIEGSNNTINEIVAALDWNKVYKLIVP